MSKVIQLFLVLVLLQTSVFAQNSVNNYKYIVIPNQFDFQRSDDQYQLNSLSKFLFNKYGFRAYLEDEDLPSDVSQNRCLALKADLKKLKGFLITRVQYELTDCNGNVVSTSQIGETKVKQYDTAYNIALRQAFETYQNMNYSYEPLSKEASVAATKNETVEQPVEVIQSVEVKKPEVKEEVKKEVKETETAVAEVVETVEKKMESVKPETQPKSKVDNSWYAKPIDNGFQVMDALNKDIMTLLYSSAADVYIVKDKNAIVFKKDGYWMYSSNDGSGIKVNRIDLKF